MLRLWMRTHGGHCSFLLVTARATGSDHRPWLHTLSLQPVPHTLSLRPALALTDTGRAANAGMSCCSFGRSVPGPLPSPPMLHRTSLHGRDIFRQCPLVRRCVGCSRLVLAVLVPKMRPLHPALCPQGPS